MKVQCICGACKIYPNDAVFVVWKILNRINHKQTKIFVPYFHKHIACAWKTFQWKAFSPLIPMRTISTLTCCRLCRTHYCYWNQSMCWDGNARLVRVRHTGSVVLLLLLLFFPFSQKKKQAIQAFHKQCEGKPLVEHIQNVHLYANEFTKYTHTQRIRYGKCSISLRRFQSIKFIHLFWYSMRMNFGNFLSVCQK